MNAIWCAYPGQFWHPDCVSISNGDRIVILKSGLNQILDTTGLNFKQNNAAAQLFIIKNKKLSMLFRIATILISGSNGTFFSSAVSVPGSIQPMDNYISVAVFPGVRMDLMQSS